MSYQLWLRRAGVVLAVGLPWILLLLPHPGGDAGRQGADIRERDLIRVYAELPDRLNYEELGDWCGLRVTRLRDEDMAAVVAALHDAKEEWVCRPFGARTPLDFVRDKPLKQVKKERWIRIHHRTAPDQWIAALVVEIGSTGRSDYEMFLIRIPIGFQPPLPPAAPKG